MQVMEEKVKVGRGNEMKRSSIDMKASSKPNVIA